MTHPRLCDIYLPARWIEPAARVALLALVIWGLM